MQGAEFRLSLLPRALTGARNEGLLAIERVLFPRILIAHVLAVRLHVAGLGLLLHVGAQDVVFQHANQSLALYREQHLDAAIQVAWHQVGAAEVDLLVAAVAEVKNAAVLEEATHDAGYLDVVADAGDAGPQAA